MFTQDGEEVGFLQFADAHQQQPVRLIELCAIAPTYGNQKIGSRMISMYIESLLVHTQVMVYCNKYSRAMQHVLTKLKFQRDKQATRVEDEHEVSHLETFHFTKQADAARPNLPLVATPQKNISRLQVAMHIPRSGRLVK